MLGNLTRDNELKYLPSGQAICKNAIATSHKYKTSTGEQKEEVMFLDFTIFAKQGEVFNQYTKKGSKVMLEGRLIFEQWTAQDGTNRNRHSLRVESFKFLDTKQDNQSQPQQGYNHSGDGMNRPANHEVNAQQQKPKDMSIPEYDISEDEIPF